MQKIKKTYNFKIIAATLILTFFCTTTLYPYPLSKKDILRVPSCFQNKEQKERIKNAVIESRKYRAILKYEDKFASIYNKVLRVIKDKLAYLCMAYDDRILEVLNDEDVRANIAVGTTAMIILTPIILTRGKILGLIFSDDPASIILVVGFWLSILTGWLVSWLITGFAYLGYGILLFIHKIFETLALAKIGEGHMPATEAAHTLGKKDAVNPEAISNLVIESENKNAAVLQAAHENPESLNRLKLLPDVIGGSL